MASSKMENVNGKFVHVLKLQEHEARVILDLIDKDTLKPPVLNIRRANILGLDGTLKSHKINLG